MGRELVFAKDALRAKRMARNLSGLAFQAPRSVFLLQRSLAHTPDGSALRADSRFCPAYPRLTTQFRF